MGFISLKKLSEQTKIDFYQLEKYIKYMGFDVTEENKIKYLNRYWKRFSSEEKISHLASIKNDELLLEKITQLSDIEKIKLIDCLSKITIESKIKTKKSNLYRNLSIILNFIIFLQ